MSVRISWSPAGRASCEVFTDQTPILDVSEPDRGRTFVIMPRRMSEVTADELEAARSLLAALTVFVRDCELHWSPIPTPTAPSSSVPTAGRVR